MGELFNCVEASVRYGEEPDNPTLLNRYILLSEQKAADIVNVVQKRIVYYRVTNVLLEAICDTYIDRQWRSLCLDNIYRPLFAIQRLVTSLDSERQLQECRNEVQKMANYFL